MYSSEDLEKFYFDYQTEWMPRGMSIQAYCSRNNVPYKVLDRWIRDIYKKVVPVQIIGTPEELKIENPRHTATRQETTKGNDNVIIKISISTSSGMELSRDGLDYSGLKMFIEKNWRACYAEHNRNEQILLHQELYGYALQVQQDPSSDPSSAWKGAAERRSVYCDVKEPQACPSVFVRQDLFQSLREALCTGISVHECR